MPYQWSSGKESLFRIMDRSFRVVIADDDPGCRETLGELLEPHFAVFTVECGEQAVEFVERERVDLLLCDMHMHVLSGLETILIVRQRMWVPAILITSDRTDELQKRASQAAVPVLDKPIARSLLMATISKSLRTVLAELDGKKFLSGS